MSSSSSSSSTNSSSQYPEAIQLKLYQAFIFSIPILFSIILFLLFYLFYLKRRRTPLLPTTHTTTITTPCGSDLKNHELNNKLTQILFDECMKATSDSLCCVCLGEFEVKEELAEIVKCKHIFHIDCILHWLHNNSTCPLCRAPVNFSPDYNNHFYSKFHHPNFPIHNHPSPPPPPPPSQILQMLHYTITSSHHAPSSSSSSSTITTTAS